MYIVTLSVFEHLIIIFFQVTIFTIGVWHRRFRSKAIVSDSLDHRKDAIVPYLFLILQRLPTTATRVVIWSDNPSSQFKNKYIMRSVKVLSELLRKEISWSFFAAQHGKGVVDGIGACVKLFVRRKVINRQVVVNDAVSFADTAKTIQNIEVSFVSKSQIEQISDELCLKDVFSTSGLVNGIASNYFVSFLEGKPKLYLVKKFVN